MSRKVIVLKFGSSVLQSRADLPQAVHEIYRWIRRQYQRGRRGFGLRGRNRSAAGNG